MWTVPNIALLTECRLLSDSLAINMSLLLSEEQEERNVYRPRELDIVFAPEGRNVYRRRQLHTSSLRRSEMFIDVESLISSSLR